MKVYIYVKLGFVFFVDVDKLVICKLIDVIVCIVKIIICGIDFYIIKGDVFVC